MSSMGQNLPKCNRQNHFETVCGMLPPRRWQVNHSAVNELRNTSSLMSNSATPASHSFSNKVSKQIVDIVDMANSVDNLSKCYKRQLELDTSTTSESMSSTQTQILSNIEIDSILLHGKQDTGAEVNIMPMNIYDQLNLKLQGKLQLRPCSDVCYSKQSVRIVGKVSVTCIHANIIKKCIFYVTDINDTKILLGLNFCRVFNLVTVNCDEQCVCKKIAIDVINEFPKGLDVPNQRTRQSLPPPVDIETKLRADCKSHIMVLFPTFLMELGPSKIQLSNWT